MKYHLIALLATILFSTYPTFTKLLVSENHPLAIVAATGIATGFLITLVFGAATEGKKIIKAKRTDGWLILLALLSGAIGPTLLLRGLERSSVANAVLILSFTTPIAAILSAFVLREKLKKAHFMGLLVLFFGMTIYSTDLYRLPIHFSLNDIFILAAALAYAMSNIIYKKKLSHLSHEMIVLSRNLFGGLMILLFIPVFSLEVPIQLTFDTQTIVAFALLVLVSITSAQWLWYTALEHIKIRDGAFIDSLYPLFATAIAFLILKEAPTSGQLVGSLVVVVGLILSQVTNHHFPLHNHHEERKKQLKLRGMQH